MAIASTPTLLSLDRYAKIMGITPLHFNQATATGTGGVELYPIASAACTGIWYQYGWQTDDGIGREDLAIAIADAEQDIADFLGYYPAPKYISQEFHQYPKHWFRSAIGKGLNSLGKFKSIIADYGRFIQAGRRAVDLVDIPTVVYTDEDGDGFYETATVTATTTLTDTCEIKAYFTGNGGVPEYEIREPKSVSISSGTLTMVFNSWQLLNPDLWEAIPTSNDGDTKIEITDVSNFVNSIDVYREYTDFTQDSAKFFWENFSSATSLFCASCGGTGCEQCTLATQGGCLHVRDVKMGIVVPTPATYNNTDSKWNNVNWGECREPDQLKIWYLAGDYDARYKSGASCEPLSNYWATTIAWLATARLGGRMCDCNSSFGRFSKELQADIGDAEGNSYFGIDVTDNPFGTRVGEVRVWRRLAKFNRQQMKGFAV